MVPTVVVPVMTLGNCVFLPQQLMPLRIFEPRYRKMLKDPRRQPHVRDLAIGRRQPLAGQR